MASVQRNFAIWLITMVSCLIAKVIAVYLTAHDVWQIVTMLTLAPGIYVVLIYLTQRKLFKIVLSIKE
jgi:hypothetical protein